MTLNCLLALGHAGRFSSFNPHTLRDCTSTSGSIEIFPCACGNGEFAWGSLLFSPDFLEKFSSFEIKIFDLSGNQLLGPIDITKTGGRLDLSELDTSYTSLVLEFESSLSSTELWTEPIKGSIKIAERAVLIK